MLESDIISIAEKLQRTLPSRLSRCKLLAAKADAAMYRAKMRGKIVVFFLKEASIDTINHSLVLLVLMAFALGVRHGFDLDHLATIDSITRTVKGKARLSKFVGCLFSLGHGSVVILMSVLIGGGIIKTRSPVWLEMFGSWVSIFFLLLFGFVTFWNIRPDKLTLPTGLKFFLFKKLMRDKINPFLIIVIGALFAFSFDTFTQVTLLSLSASVMGGLFCSTLLGIVFMFGMMVSDGVNGWFVSSILQFADKRSVIFSRVMGVMIASFSLLLGLAGLLNQLTNS